MAVASVMFEPGPDGLASHPLGQTLIVTEGYRLGAGLGRQGPGDPGGRRRPYSAEPEALARGHGDDAHDAHLRREHLDGKNVEVMERVSDEQYRP